MEEALLKNPQPQHPQVNNGVYKAGFATSQTAHDAAAAALFEALARLDERLGNRRFLHGDWCVAHFVGAGPLYGMPKTGSRRVMCGSTQPSFDWMQCIQCSLRSPSGAWLIIPTCTAGWWTCTSRRCQGPCRWCPNCDASFVVGCGCFVANTFSLSSQISDTFDLEDARKSYFRQVCVFWAAASVTGTCSLYSCFRSTRGALFLMDRLLRTFLL